MDPLDEAIRHTKYGQPTEADRERYRRFIEYEAERLTIAAAKLGVVVTIDLQPLGHAMGSYVMVPHTRLARTRV